MLRRNRILFGSDRRDTLARIYRLVGEAPPWEGSDRPPDHTLIMAVEFVTRESTTMRLRALVELLVAARERGVESGRMRTESGGAGHEGGAQSTMR